MVQYHTWAPYICIDEHKYDIIGISCCNNCRSLPKPVAMPNEKMAVLHQKCRLYYLPLLNIRPWLKQQNTNNSAVNGRNEEIPTTLCAQQYYDSYRQTVFINPQQNESHANSYETESVHIEHVLVGEPLLSTKRTVCTLTYEYEYEYEYPLFGHVLT